MSGFSADWLARREAADHAARNPALRDAVVAGCAGAEQLEIVDLGCGTGSNLRALAEYLPARQSWRLVDNDPALFTAAREALVAWADAVESVEPLVLRTGRRSLQVVFQQEDLARFDGEALAQGAGLVTAAAFFDLASKAWIERLCGELARRRLPLYAVLSYSGEETWSPPHGADAAMLKAFHAHQARDKGFGPAAGPRAVDCLQRALEGHGYHVATAPSPWRLGGRIDRGARRRRRRGGRRDRARSAGDRRGLATGAPRGEILRDRPS